MAVTTHVSLDAFFHEVVTDALDTAGVEASDHTEFYLVGLLREFAHSRISDEPLSMKLAQAAEAPARDQIATLKEVGDTTLVVTGMFAEWFDRRPVNADYYMGLGESAYRQLATRLSASRGSEEVFRELADKFDRFVNVLHRVRDRVKLSDDGLGAYLILGGDDGALH